MPRKRIRSSRRRRSGTQEGDVPMFYASLRILNVSAPIRFWVACLGTLMLGTACSWFKSSPSAFVPMQATAAEQWHYAETYKANRNLSLIPGDQERRFQATREIVRQHYAKVVEYFPGDRFETPLAKLTLLEMEAGLDSERVKVTNKMIRESIGKFTKLAEEYPEMEFLQAKSLYDQAMCYQRLGDFDNSGTCYHNAWKQFENSTNTTVKNISDRARLNYNKTQIKE